MPYLTEENAHLYEGKTLDAHARRFHYYPLKVVKPIDQNYMYVDVNGVYMPVPPEKDKFNTVYFDFVVGDV